jgi:hypothetical protein
LKNTISPGAKVFLEKTSAKMMNQLPRSAGVRCGWRFSFRTNVPGTSINPSFATGSVEKNPLRVAFGPFLDESAIIYHQT